MLLTTILLALYASVCVRACACVCVCMCDTCVSFNKLLPDTNWPLLLLCPLGARATKYAAHFAYNLINIYATLNGPQRSAAAQQSAQLSPARQQGNSFATLCQKVTAKSARSRRAAAATTTITS